MSIKKEAAVIGGTWTFSQIERPAIALTQVTATIKLHEYLSHNPDLVPAIGLVYIAMMALGAAIDTYALHHNISIHHTTNIAKSMTKRIGWLQDHPLAQDIAAVAAANVWGIGPAKSTDPSVYWMAWKMNEGDSLAFPAKLGVEACYLVWGMIKNVGFEKLSRTEIFTRFTKSQGLR